MSELFPQLKGFFDANDNFAVVCHARPDEDALGSLLALARYLELVGKTAHCYCFDIIPNHLSFLINGTIIAHEIDSHWQNAQAVVFVDCGDLKMAKVLPQALIGKKTAVIDHHITNPQYADINIVLSEAAATAEIIFNYFNFINFNINKKIATYLLAGIYGDTDSFSNLATTPTALATASALLVLGAAFKDITANIIGNKSVASLKLLGRALERIKLDKEKGVATTVIKEKDLEECKAKMEDSEGISSLFNHLADVKMSLVLREQPDGTVRGSLRTTDDLIDVSEMAKIQGGGGHKKAAGFIAKGRVVEKENRWEIEE